MDGIGLPFLLQGYPALPANLFFNRLFRDLSSHPPHPSSRTEHYGLTMYFRHLAVYSGLSPVSTMRCQAHKRPSRTISLVQDGLFTCYSASLPAEAASLMADNASSKESPLPPLPCTTPAISALYAHQRTRTLPCSPDCCTFTPIRNVPFCG
jgi:hypothetical protein